MLSYFNVLGLLVVFSPYLLCDPDLKATSLLIDGNDTFFPEIGK